MMTKDDEWFNSISALCQENEVEELIKLMEIPGNISRAEGDHEGFCILLRTAVLHNSKEVVEYLITDERLKSILGYTPNDIDILKESIEKKNIEMFELLYQYLPDNIALRKKHITESLRKALFHEVYEISDYILSNSDLYNECDMQDVIWTCAVFLPLKNYIQITSDSRMYTNVNKEDLLLKISEQKDLNKDVICYLIVTENIAYSSDIKEHLNKYNVDYAINLFEKREMCHHLSQSLENKNNSPQQKI